MPKILIIEDDNFLLEMLAKTSIKEGLDIEIAVNGEDGLEKIGGGKFDLILLDLVLPKMHGLEVLTKLKEENNPTPVIVLSNLFDQESIDKATALGAKDYIIKAQSIPKDIVQKVKTFLSENK
ncbi:response regulator [bacterium]|jgi:DNA-binding response OmpR family regulator|nr:response regulator [bacterium]MBT3729806.1 response regulator [bacterium]MBT4894719.1 response regulator [bacterium]